MEIAINMNIIQFCNENNIKTLPIRIDITGIKKEYCDAKYGDNLWNKEN